MGFILGIQEFFNTYKSVIVNTTHSNRFEKADATWLPSIGEKKQLFVKSQPPLIIKKYAPIRGHRRKPTLTWEGYIQQTHSKHHSQWWKFKGISSKIRNKTMTSILTIFIQHSLGSSIHGNQRRKIKESTLKESK